MLEYGESESCIGKGENEKSRTIDVEASFYSRPDSSAMFTAMLQGAIHRDCQPSRCRFTHTKAVSRPDEVSYLVNA